MQRLDVLPGLGRDNINKLNKMGIKTTLDLLTRGALPTDRAEIAKELTVETSTLIRWIIDCDFFRLKGMRTEYVDLLHKVGITAVQELAFVSPELFGKMLENVNSFPNPLPSRQLIKSWIKQTVDLKPIIWFDGMFCLGLRTKR